MALHIFHLNFQSLQNVLRRAPFVAKRFAAEVKCDHPRCEICELAKAKRRSKRSETKTKDPERYGAIKVIHLSPGTRVSVETMNSFYVANDTVVISIALFSPERPEKEEGWNITNRRFGLGRLVLSPF
jgi:hypothetical protein